MNRPQSAPLPETLGLIVREYLRAIPERLRVWPETPGTNDEVMSKLPNREGNTTSFRDSCQLRPAEGGPTGQSRFGLLGR